VKHAEILPDWQRRFPGCQPVGYLLREAFPERWVRFHSLPGSKRYAENEAETATILERHNRILGELAPPGQEVVLLITGHSETPDPADLRSEVQALDPAAVPWRTFVPDGEDDDFGTPSYWHVYGSRQEWRPGLFDPVVRLAADDKIYNLMIVAPDCRWLLHPYDGGMDVIAASTAARDRLKARYRKWLSARPDGL
jgi:hypothetical protein